MTNTNEKANPLEYQILRMMKESNQPFGAGLINESLREQDINISEAGVGRVLRGLRQKGYLQRVGFQGHSITECGLNRLEELEDKREFGETLKNLLSAGTMQGHNVIDILVARRALEREAAFQAAQNATPEDIRRLEEIITAQYRGMEKDENYADLSTAFHREIVSAAHAPILKNLYELIGLSVQWQDFFIGTFKMYNQPMNVSHEKVLSAIKKRDPQKAAEYMEKHLADVINNARKLCLDSDRL